MSRCDIARDAMQASLRGRCAAADAPPECAAFGLATQTDMLGNITYSPASVYDYDGLTRGSIARALQIGIQNRTARLRAKYGSAAPLPTRWHQFTRCRWNAQGAPDGHFGNKYIAREDLAFAGYKPQPLVGGAALAGAFLTLPGSAPPISTSPVPVWFDRVANPNLMLAFIGVLLLAISRALVHRARQPRPPIIRRNFGRGQDPSDKNVRAPT